ncbi:MAG: response regulator, partial [Methanomicrobiales archaeon]|nr:response regulator [Methanomicrobiales archaeon]
MADERLASGVAWDPSSGSRHEVCILIVEDSPTQAAILRHLLEGAGYNVSVAENGCVALAMIEQAQPSIVLTDIVMPEMDGYELCRQIKATGATKDLPVILVTQLFDPGDVIRGLECGADNFIIKPYDPTYLLSRIEMILINVNIPRQYGLQIGIEVFFAGKRHYITSDRLQILNILLSTYEIAVKKNAELQEAQEKLANLNDELSTIVTDLKCANDDLQNEILERKRVEFALRDSEERYRQIIESAPNPIVISSPDTNQVLYLNRPAALLFGLSQEEAVGMLTPNFYVDPKERQRLIESVQQKGGVSDFETRLKTSEGRPFWAYMSAITTRFEGKPAVFVSFSDISERKRMEEALSGALKKLYLLSSITRHDIL